MPRQPDDYAKLKALWYKKLEAEGFKDIEDDKENLKSWSSRFANSRIRELWQEKEPYYYMATQFLNEYKFANNLERIIWEYHANALSVRDITEVLKKTKVSKTNRQTVWLTVKRLENSMKAMYMAGYQSE